MLSQSQLDRLSRKCARAISQAIDALPRLLEESEPDAAARIVADLLIKTQISSQPVHAERPSTEDRWNQVFRALSEHQDP